MADSSVLPNGVFRTTFFPVQNVVPIGVFIIAGTHGSNDIIKSILSAKGLHYSNIRIYLIDNSHDEQNRFIAKAFSIKYINAPYNDAMIHEKIAEMDITIETIVITAGETVSKKMLFQPSRRSKNSTQTADSSSREGLSIEPADRLSSLGDYAASALISIKQQLSVAAEQSLDVLSNTRSALANIRNRSAVYALLVAVVIVLLSGYIFAHRGQVADSVKVTNNNSNNIQQKTATTTKSANTNLVNPDRQQPQAATFTIQPGDSMSSIITNYVNQMHKSFPQLSLARLGYAQDKLMNIYGYKPLPASQKTFVVSAADVKSAWDTANQADSWEVFWSDYAKRAGIEW